MSTNFSGKPIKWLRIEGLETAKIRSLTALQAGRHWFKSSIAHLPLPLLSRRLKRLVFVHSRFIGHW